MADKPRLGSGARFRALRDQLAKKPATKNASGLAAFIGRKRYGEDRFQQLSTQGRKK